MVSVQTMLGRLGIFLLNVVLFARSSNGKYLIVETENESSNKSYNIKEDGCENIRQIMLV